MVRAVFALRRHVVSVAHRILSSETHNAIPGVVRPAWFCHANAVKSQTALCFDTGVRHCSSSSATQSTPTPEAPSSSALSDPVAPEISVPDTVAQAQGHESVDPSMRAVIKEVDRVMEMPEINGNPIALDF
eukprot:980441-Rhodomonas_salina.1